MAGSANRTRRRRTQTRTQVYGQLPTRSHRRPMLTSHSGGCASVTSAAHAECRPAPAHTLTCMFRVRATRPAGIRRRVRCPVRVSTSERIASVAVTFSRVRSHTRTTLSALRYALLRSSCCFVRAHIKPLVVGCAACSFVRRRCRRRRRRSEFLQSQAITAGQ